MKPCICQRLYHANTPTTTIEYAFSGSLCCIHRFETVDGLRYCLTTFSVHDYTHLHFPHDEYKYLIDKLYALLSTKTSSEVGKLNGSTLSIEHLPCDEFKIKFGGNCLNIGPVTAFGLVNTSPFENVDVLSLNKIHYLCDSKWDICTCATCPVFKRLVDYEANALTEKPENVIFV